MPRVELPDGVELHYEEHGEGPLVVLAGYWSSHPSAWSSLISELETDHRLVRYDDRGSGQSTRRGPYDLDTAAADLGHVIAALGPAAVVMCLADGVNRALRVAARRPELVSAIVTLGASGLGRSSFTGMDVLAGSDTVIEALLSQVETDYRGTLRGLMAVTNPQMTEDELRERIAVQVDYAPQEGAIERLKAWANDEPKELALAMGDRLWVVVPEVATGGWFPSGQQMVDVVRREIPQANVVSVTDGIVSRPDETAAVIRQVTASVREPQEAT